ncbi:hypothetical protein JRO89_XS10G0158600 [Xanthoceras sorbifolium]|uniref:C2H2-type domain-containing protein n=1 Tax=Xanthoceras sorbifolium TaxID=99658 RepID=A0ABQ8HIW0_9ROSI|nr:hypothetical protein JRO89_XS10G0158600 [Xanthoceras sorbifolium]
MMSQDHPGLSVPSTITKEFAQQPNSNPNPNPNSNNPSKRKRNLPGTPDPDAEVIAMSPTSLMATNRFVCEICNKGFQRDQNLQLHRRGHNLPWKLKQRAKTEIVRKKVYICPEKTCVHHDPSRALGDLTGIKKHFSRKHGEKKWKCEKCSKKYAVQSDWKAHSKICGTREYRCDCGTLFSRKDSFITHRAFCDALAEESARFTSNISSTNPNFRSNEFGTSSSSNPHHQAVGNHQILSVLGGSGGDGQKPRLPLWLDQASSIATNSNNNAFLMTPNSTATGSCLPDHQLAQMAAAAAAAAPMSNMFGSLSQMQWFNNKLYPKEEDHHEEENKGYNNNNLSESITSSSLYPTNNPTVPSSSSAHMSATALLQKAAQMGSTRSNPAALNTAPTTTTTTTSTTHGFGLMSSSSFNSYNNQQQDKSHHQAQAALLQNRNFNELMNSISSSSSLMGINNSKGFPVAAAAGSLININGSSSEVERSLTRDFLGVGGEEEEASRPYFHQELAKFMDLSQYP